MTKQLIPTSPLEQPLQENEAGSKKGGRKKIDPILRQRNQRENIKQYKQSKRIWQAYTTDLIMLKSDMLMKHLGFKTKHQLLEWLLERESEVLPARKVDLVLMQLHLHKISSVAQTIEQAFQNQ